MYQYYCFVVIVIAISLCACTSGAGVVCEDKEKKSILIHSSKEINQSIVGEALPINIRIHQLSSLSELQQMNFEDMWKRAEQSLPNTLLWTEEFTLYPEESSTINVIRERDARYLAIVALVRRPQGRSWIAVKDFDSGESSSRSHCSGDSNLNTSIFAEFKIEGYEIYLIED